MLYFPSYNPHETYNICGTMNQRQQESLHTSHMSECCYYLPYVYMYSMSFMLTCKVHICILQPH